MELAATKTMEPETCASKIFDFALLPFVCQRRFAEICDGKTLRTFASINSSTRDISKRCHFIEHLEIKVDASTCQHDPDCSCNENGFCNGDTDLSLYNCEWVQHYNIKKPEGQLEARHLQNLPISIRSTDKLSFFVETIDLKDLQKLTTMEFKFLNFIGNIEADSLTDFINFITDLSKRANFE